MKKNTKILWAFLTPLPILLVIVGIACFALFFFSHIAEMSQHTPKGSAEPPSPELFRAIFKGFFLGYGLILLGVLSHFLVSVSYFIHLVRSETVNKENKTMWVVLFMVFHVLAMIPYWFVVVWPEPEPKGKRD